MQRVNRVKAPTGRHEPAHPDFPSHLLATVIGVSVITHYRHAWPCFATQTSLLDRTSDWCPRLLHGIASQFNRNAMASCTGTMRCASCTVATRRHVKASDANPRLRDRTELQSRNATACVCLPRPETGLEIGLQQWTGKFNPSRSSRSRCRHGLLRPRMALLRNSIATEGYFRWELRLQG